MGVQEVARTSFTNTSHIKVGIFGSAALSSSHNYILTSPRPQSSSSPLRYNRFEALYVLAITTGLRRGEILGLRWQAVELEGAIIRVRQHRE